MIFASLLACALLCSVVQFGVGSFSYWRFAAHTNLSQHQFTVTKTMNSKPLNITEIEQMHAAYRPKHNTQWRDNNVQNQHNKPNEILRKHETNRERAKKRKRRRRTAKKTIAKTKNTRVAKVIIIRIANVRHPTRLYEWADRAIYGWHATIKTGKFLV